MTVWDDLVGQEPVVDLLSRVVAEPGAMTHAWLFTGPPGSGRSNAALAFAAALQCELGGCGACSSCVSAAAGSHPDIAVVSTDGLSIGVDIARDVVRRSALHSALGRWQVLVVEDADRLTDQAANALLKAIEEPAPRTVWMLCAPAVEDVIVTIRSRCRAVLLRTPSTSAISRLLVERDGVEPALAAATAAASQGHIGRARGLARDPAARDRRREILALPAGVGHLGDALVAAQRIDAEATARATTHCDVADARELDDLKAAWGVEDRGRRPAGYAGALSALTKEQERRRKRMARDAIDGVLLDLLAYCRDVITLQLEAVSGPDQLINADVAELAADSARLWTPESTMAAIDAIVECRAALEANAAPLLALERLMARFVR
ncbi:DNA polymerase III, delta' subunit [Aeromicrobium marinum DSM 15272]|uniref:DNA polymerase III, delta' subunit n=1 Tax=Aeromicrobium marinum DSM 15272 TaxID=585531 RepID=E2SFJ5_9ACTN|nr:DNA polymerase III subunit delta' [Aeromicrobium marinum]EFQ82096.1 DNA polymerase III, delta' subunit [Aeromicrobium marinum DSM 15272]